MTTISIDPQDLRDVIDQAVQAAIEADRRERRTEVAPAEEPLLYSLADAARLLDVSESGLRNWRRQGLINVVCVGTSVKVSRQELERIASEGVAE